MSVDSQMRQHGFAPWRSLHGVQGFQKVVKKGATHSIVVMPVNVRRIQSGDEKVLACHFDKQNQMRADRFYDSLHSFLQSHELDASLLGAQGANNSHSTGSLLALCLGVKAILRKSLLFAK